MIKVNKMDRVTLNLSQEHDNDANGIQFDIGEWVKKFGPGTVTLTHKRKGDKIPYPVNLEVEDGIATWIVSDVDTAVKGYGAAQLMYQPDDTEILAQSAVAKTLTLSSNYGIGSTPDPYDNWMAELTEKAGETLHNVSEAKAAEIGAKEAEANAEQIKADVDGLKKTVESEIRTAHEDISKAVDEFEDRADAVKSELNVEGAKIVADATTAKNEAVTAKNGAESAAERANESKEAAANKAIEAKTYRDQAETFKNKAAESKADAEAVKTAVNEAKSATQAFKEETAEIVQGFDAKVSSAKGEIDAKKAEAVKAVEDTIADIPEDYSALVEDVSNVKKDLQSVGKVTIGKNLYNKDAIVSGYLNPDGTIHEDNGNGWMITDFIDVTEAKYIICSMERSGDGVRIPTTPFFVTEYDANKNVIKQTVQGVSNGYEISDKAVYLKLCNNTTQRNNYQIESGLTVTAYEPYSATFFVDVSKLPSIDNISNRVIGLKNLKDGLYDNFIPSDFEEQIIEYPNQAYIEFSTGNITPYNNVYCTDFIDCSNINAIHYVGKTFYNGRCIFFYDEKNTPLSYYPSQTSGIVLFDDTVTVPINAKYVRFGDYSRVTGTPVSVAYSTSATIITNRWNDKKWVCIGDSLTEFNSRTTMHYHDYIKELTGISVVNMGVSGSGYGKRVDTNQAFYQRAVNIPTDADVITIFGSFNDMSSTLAVGTYLDSDTTTLAGCMNATIDAIQSRIPLANIGIVSPTPWTTTQPNETGKAYEYVAVMKRICEHRSIPFLDLWRCSNLRPWDADFRPIAYSKDDGNGVHPDETGHKIIAPRFKAFLESLLM